MSKELFSFAVAGNSGPKDSKSVSWDWPLSLLTPAGFDPPCHLHTPESLTLKAAATYYVHIKATDQMKLPQQQAPHVDSVDYLLPPVLEPPGLRKLLVSTSNFSSFHPRLQAALKELRMSLLRYECWALNSPHFPAWLSRARRPGASRGPDGPYGRPCPSLSSFPPIFRPPNPLVPTITTPISLPGPQRRTCRSPRS